MGCLEPADGAGVVGSRSLSAADDSSAILGEVTGARLAGGHWSEAAQIQRRGWCLRPVLSDGGEESAKRRPTIDGLGELVSNRKDAADDSDYESTAGCFRWAPDYWCSISLYL
jgi:hypothetical protein